MKKGSATEHYLQTNARGDYDSAVIAEGVQETVTTNSRIILK